jgi:hypothetical protein
MSHTDATALLAGLYQTPREALAVARRAEVPEQFIEPEGSAITLRTSILAEARKRERLPRIEEVVVEDYPGLDFSALRTAPTPGFQPRLRAPLGEYEKIMGAQPTLLPISFLSRGLDLARSVARIVGANGDYGSGFLIDGNRLVTNHHVFPSAEFAVNSYVQFGYEIAEGGVRAPVIFEVESQGFATSQPDDWTVVRLKGDANREWGAVPLRRTTVQPDQFVNIIQHPGGGPKQIALYHNVVVYSDASRVQYLTDTMPGSSGSPVFDTEWRVVAIHHSGGVLGKSATHYCNEGIAINVLLDAIS